LERHVISNFVQLGGFGALTYGTYLEAGRGPACLVGGFLLVVLSLALEGATVRAAATAWSEKRTARKLERVTQRQLKSVA
jgi:hypothetical protein